MKFYLISDNADTLMGMRIAGIEGEIVHSAEQTVAALEKAFTDEEIAIVLLTEKLVEMCRDRVYEYKLSRTRPLIVEIPDRHGSSDITAAISRYVEEAIGIKL
ncbi:MAG: V-type ATP synthase subunit F [Oscillospiraceae bacterium]